VSDVFRRLRTGARELDGLYQDASTPVFARLDWNGTTFARRTLAEGVPIEVWFLAEHFLQTWHDWHGLWDRCLRYFGQPSERFPRKWSDMDTRCLDLAKRLLRDAQLDEIVAASWRRGLAADVRQGRVKEPSAESFTYQAIINHGRLSLLLTAETWADDSGAAPGPPSASIWPNALATTRQINARLSALWDELPRRVREQGLWQFRNYRRANLLASWLLADSPLATRTQQSAFLHALTAEQPVTPTTEDFIRLLNVADGDRRTVARVLQRLTQAIAEFGYDEFIEDVTSGDFLGGDDSPVGSSDINLIPAKDQGTCRTTLLAVSKGADKRAALGFARIMARVKTHLIDCGDTTRVVLFLCDHWSPTTLEEHLEELRAHHRRGVRFLFLLAGTPSRLIAPVAVDLALSS
jgi:hypothetical protein